MDFAISEHNPRLQFSIFLPNEAEIKNSEPKERRNNDVTEGHLHLNNIASSLPSPSSFHNPPSHKKLFVGDPLPPTVNKERTKIPNSKPKSPRKGKLTRKKNPENSQSRSSYQTSQTISLLKRFTGERTRKKQNKYRI